MCGSSLPSDGSVSLCARPSARLSPTYLMCGVCRDAFVRVSLSVRPCPSSILSTAAIEPGEKLDPTDLFRTCLHGAWYPRACTLRNWATAAGSPLLGCRRPGSAASSTRSAWASPARRVRGPFYATDVRGVRGGAPQFRLDRRGRHRRAASGALSGHGCAGRARRSAASSTRSAWASPARRVRGPLTQRMCSARAGERCMVDSNSRAVRARVVELVCHA